MHYQIHPDNRLAAILAPGWTSFHWIAALYHDHHAGSVLMRTHAGNKLTTEEVKMDINIGIDKKDRAAIAEGMSRLLADSYTLYLKSHNFHWNVTGPMFNTLHFMFETQYTELALAVDQIAERIRALGFPAPGGYADFSRLSSTSEARGLPTAEGMIRKLVKGQEAVISNARAIFPEVDRVSDEPSTDLLTQRMQVHEKNAWMLRSLP